MQTTISRVLTVVALLIALFLAYVIYTQGEMIRLYVRRWKALKKPEAAQIKPESAPAG